MKNTRRIIALCLAIVMMMSMAITASAASYDFTLNGQSYTAHVTEGSTVYKYKYLSRGEEKEHTGGTATTLSLPAGSFGFYADSFKSSYSSYLDQALKRTTNLNTYRLFTTSSARTCSVGPDEPAGTYGVYAAVSCRTAPWWVENSDLGTIESGTLPYAPTTYCTYVAMPV